MGGGAAATKRCGLTENLIFVAAIVSGTACSLCSKVMMEMHSIGITGEREKFEKPLFQTFGMFIGMTFGLLMHWFVVWFDIPFPGNPTTRDLVDMKVDGAYSSNGDNSSDFVENGGSAHMAIANGQQKKQKLDRIDPYGVTESDALLSPSTADKNAPQPASSSSSSSSVTLPAWMYLFLAIPSVFDLAATALCMCGLRYLDVSIYQMLRGSGIIFVALMKQHVLRHTLHVFQWVGVFWNVVSVVLVGATALLSSADENVDKDVEGGEALLGVVLVMAGAFVQALQFVFEEKVMTMDVPAPPLLLIGVEGVWGTVICLLVLYPLAYYFPGDDHGSYEDPFNTWVMFKNSSTIQWAFVVYFVTIFLYNLFAVLVTFMLSSVWHAILDNFRPITVWVTDMFIYYFISSGTFGEPWTKWSFIQLAGMFVLLYGTAIYNAPNAGSLELRGQWWAFGIDLSREYRNIELEEEMGNGEGETTAAKQAKTKSKVTFGKDSGDYIEEGEGDYDFRFERLRQKARVRKGSFLKETSSPRISVHTQSLRGPFGSPKI